MSQSILRRFGFKMGKTRKMRCENGRMAQNRQFEGIKGQG